MYIDILTAPSAQVQSVARWHNARLWDNGIMALGLHTSVADSGVWNVGCHTVRSTTGVVLEFRPC